MKKKLMIGHPNDDDGNIKDYKELRPIYIINKCNCVFCSTERKEQAFKRFHVQ